jgi:acetyl-CoA carboxylase biotin carboxyl carrier protein
MDIREIQNLIKFVAKSGATEVKLEMDDIKITIKTTSENATVENGTYVQHIPAAMSQMQAAAPVAQAVETAAAPAAAANDDAKYITVKSPMIGTFYRSAGPDKPPFVNIGDEIQAGKPVCIIEAMKLFNEIESDVKGKIIKVLVNDATPVEYDQPLFLLDPS